MIFPAQMFSRWLLRGGWLLLALPGLLSAQTGGDEEVSEFRVNGLKVLVKRRLSSQTVAAGLFFVGGSRNQGLQNAGIERLLLNVAVTGSEKYPADRLRRELAQTAIALSAATTRDYSVVSLQCTRDEFSRAFDLLADVVLRPALAPEEFERQRGRLLAQAGDDSDPDTRLRRMVEAAVFSRHPSEAPDEGTPESLAALKAGDLRSYLDKLLQTSRLLLVVVGNVNPAEVRRLATAAFGRLPVGAPLAPVPALTFAAPSFQRTVKPLPVNFVAGVFAGPAAAGDDLPALQVAAQILSGRLFEELRTRHALSDAAAVEISLRGAVTGQISFTVGDVAAAMPVVRAELKKLVETAVSVDELRGIQAQQRTSQLTNTQTNSAQAGQLARFEIMGGGWARGLAIGADEVTPAQVQHAAQVWLRNFQFFVLGPDTRATDQTFQLP